jgi:hypothetical protein
MSLGGALQLPLDNVFFEIRYFASEVVFHFGLVSPHVIEHQLLVLNET